ncbi:hypothetical protein B4U79_09367, partial [Dinothrombium tinctorium]
FQAEAHNVTTDDGYILTLHRIVNPCHKGRAKPVLLQHGLLGSSVDFIINSPGGDIRCNEICDTILDAKESKGAHNRSSNSTSNWNILHYIQLFGTKRLSKFDYGKVGNLERYGKKTPPIYPLENIDSTNIALLYGRNDWISDSFDVNYLRKSLKGKQKTVSLRVLFEAKAKTKRRMKNAPTLISIVLIVS